jgi:mono/diheme cytochrome c family protein
MSLKKLLVSVSLLIFGVAGLQAQVQHTKSKHVSLAASIANGKKLYTQYCVTCHQADGKGVPAMNPPLINTTYVLGDKIKLIQIVLNGFNEDVQINGQTYSNNMTPHAFMKDQEIADVLTYVRNSFGNKASLVSATLVRNVRLINKK